MRKNSPIDHKRADPKHVHPSSLKLTAVWTLLCQFQLLEACVSPFGFELALERECKVAAALWLICLSRATEVCGSQGDQVQKIYLA